MNDASLTIGDVAEAAGIGVETVRYYERRKLMPQPRRGAGAYRRYDGTDRRSIRRIAAARLDETRRRIADLRRIERVLVHLLHECETHLKSPDCPIIASIGASPER